jgi:DNA-binding transcriptional ArsR family regulator
MPGPVQNLFGTSEAARVRIGLEPVYNAFESLALLHRTEDVSGLDEWVTRTVAALTPEQREKHRLVMVGLHYAANPDGNWPSFLDYLAHLSAMAPDALRDKMLQIYIRVRRDQSVTCPTMLDKPLPVDLDAVLASPDSYVRFLADRWGAEMIEPELEKRAYTYVMDPPAMQALIVSHLREMWHNHLALEWERVRPMLQDAVQAAQELDLTGADDLQAARLITGQELDEESWCPLLKRANQIVFVPSAHVGPYLGQFCERDTVRILYGARLPEGVAFSAPDLSRAEILVRLNALADSNRLHILKRISELGEQSSLDVIADLQLSQSTVSRHLKQLTATGYLVERRCNGAKCYKLNPSRIQATLQALSTFLLSR